MGATDIEFCLPVENDSITEVGEYFVRNLPKATFFDVTEGHA